MRRFEVYRRGDLSATHNNGLQGPQDLPQYEGVEFTDGTVVVRWRTEFKSTSFWNSFEELMKVHGHLNDSRYQTEVVWIDTVSPFLPDDYPDVEDYYPIW